MKTISLKKVSAVAVASLGFGLLSVVPASAAVPDVAGGVTHSLSSSVSSVAVGTAVTTTYTIGGTSVAAAAGSVVITETFPLDAGAGAQGATAAAGSALTAATSAAQATVGGNLTPTTTASSGAFSASHVMSLTPDKAGVYTVTFTPAIAKFSSAGGAVDPSVQVAAITWTIYAGYSASASTYENTSFATVGVNTTTGWGATTGGRGTVRITNLPAASNTFYVTATGGSIQSYAEVGTDGSLGSYANTNSSNLIDGFNFASTTPTSSAAVDVTVVSSTGDVTVTVSYFSASGALTIFSQPKMTVGTAAALSTANSTAVLGAGAGNSAVSGVDDVISADATTGTQRGNVTITLKDQYKNAFVGQTLSVVVSGPALVKFSQGTQATQGTASADSLTLTSSQSTAFLGINGTGVGGTATITISAGTTVIATKTVTMYGTAKTLTATAVKKFLSVGANADAVAISAKDATGNTATYTPTALSDKTSIVSSTLSNCALATSGEIALGYTKGSYYCDVTGVAVGTANLTIAPASTTTNSPVAAFQVTKSVAASVALSTNKTSYAPGEKITLTITAKDADGNPLGSGSYDLLGADSTVSQSLTGTALTNAAFEYIDGVATTTYYAPLAAGPVTFSAKLSTDAAVASAIQATTITTVPSVLDGNAALLTQIDALNAKIVALNALIAKIMKKLGVK